MALELVIKSPVGYEDATYFWPKKIQENSGALEIIETVKWVYEDYPELDHFFPREYIPHYDKKCYKSMTLFCEKFNAAIDRIRAQRLANGTMPPPPRASTGLLKHILQQAYNQAVTEPDRLNQYEPFSPEVYGETSFEFVAQMVERLNANEDDTFIDLGSGVGQVVLQVAAATSAKLCIGIEKAQVPSDYAKAMSDAFRFWMQWFGKKFSEYLLFKGDFFADSHREMINNATLIFVNNFAFGPTVDHMLKLRFAELRDGARIVSSKAFCPLNFRITDRTLSDIGSIIRIEEIHPHKKGSVSWTGKPVSYYLHTIDRRKLEDYFMKMKTPRNKRASKNSALSVHQSGNDSSSSDGKEHKEETQVYGPTTRKAWSEWCNNRQKENSQNDSLAANNSSIVQTPPSVSSPQASSVTNNTQMDLLCSSSVLTPHSDSTVSCLPQSLSLASSFANGTIHGNSETESDDGHASCSLGDDGTQSPSKTIPNKRISRPRSARNANQGDVDQPRKPGRPRKKQLSEKIKKLNFGGLELLHEQTMRSIQTTPATDTPPGCIDQKLSLMPMSFTPKDPWFGQLPSRTSLPIDTSIKQLTPAPTPKESEFSTIASPMPSIKKSIEPIFDIEDLLNRFRSQIVGFMNYMGTDEYHESVKDQIKQQKIQNEKLNKQITYLENQVKELSDSGLQLLHDRLNELGIIAPDPHELVGRAQEFIYKNRHLKDQISMLEQQLQQLEQMQNKVLDQTTTQNNSSRSMEQMHSNNIYSVSRSKSDYSSDPVSPRRKKQQTNANTVNSNCVQPLLNPANLPFKSTAPLINAAIEASLKLRSAAKAQKAQAEAQAKAFAENAAEAHAKAEAQSKAEAQAKVEAQTTVLAKEQSKLQAEMFASVNTNLNSMPEPSLNVYTQIRSVENNESSSQISSISSFTTESVSKCNNSTVGGNNSLANLTSMSTPSSTSTSFGVYSNSSSLIKQAENLMNKRVDNTRDQVDHTSAHHQTYQFPNIEDRIKSMIVAALNDDTNKHEIVTPPTTVISTPSKGSKREVKRGRTPKKVAAAAAAAAANASSDAQGNILNRSTLNNYGTLSNGGSYRASNGSLDARYPANEPQIVHNPQISNLSSGVPTQSPSYASIAPASRKYDDTSSVPSHREGGSALKLTLKIDRERDSYALVKSPPKSPEKASSKSSSPKRRQQQLSNISPDQVAKSRRSRSPKYSSAISTSQKHEGRLILKVSNGHAHYVTDKGSSAEGFGDDGQTNGLDQPGSHLHRPFKCVTNGAVNKKR